VSDPQQKIRKGVINMCWSSPSILRHLYFYKVFFYSAAMVLLLAACVPRTQRSSFDPKKCMEHMPRRVKGLTIVSGPRTERNIIREMVPAMCSGHALFKHMKTEGEEISPGYVVLRIIVEYTGEVASVEVEETTIQSEKFLCGIKDFVMETDFVLWAVDDEDTVFLYPVTFGE
jgi:hypothetical protein